MDINTQALYDQISNLQLENNYLTLALNSEKTIIDKAKNDSEWAVFNSNQINIALDIANNNIQVRDKLIIDLNNQIESLNAEVTKLNSKLISTTTIVNDLTKQNIKLIEKRNA